MSDKQQLVKEDLNKSVREKPYIRKPYFYTLNMIFLVLVSPIIVFLLVKLFSKGDSHFHWVELKFFEYDFQNAKLSLFVEFGLYITFFFLTTNLTSQVCRILYKRPEPLIGVIPKPMQAILRVIQNTYEQLMLFLPTYTYAVLKTEDTGMLNTLYYLAFIWIIARFLYFGGYFIGSTFNFTYLRTYGYGLNLSIAVFLLINVFYENPFYMNSWAK